MGPEEAEVMAEAKAMAAATHRPEGGSVHHLPSVPLPTVRFPCM